MRTSRKVALSLALLIVGGLAMCKLAYPAYTYHYRMTVNVEADGKVYSGSSVIEVRLIKQVQLTMEMPPVKTEISGEAVFVDLGGGRNVIALLASGAKAQNVDYPKYIVAKHFNLSYENHDLVKFPKLQGSWEESELPTIISFSDLNDPKTARVVGAFDEVFGPGVRLRDVAIEMASGPVTRGLQKKLPLLLSHRDEMWRANSNPTKFIPQYHLFSRD